MAFTINEFPWSKYYDSDLREVLEYMREFEKELKRYAEAIEQLEAALPRITALENATKDLPTIRANISKLQKDVSDLANMDAALQGQINRIKLDIVNIHNDIAKVYSYIDSCILDLDTKWKVKLIQLQNIMNLKFIKLTDAIEELSRRIDNIDTSVINPWHSLEDKISNQRNVNYIYNELADEILTAEQYCRLGLSADDYSMFDIDAREYAEFGKSRLHFYWVYSPTFGWRQEISNVLTSIVNEIMDTLTATEYSALELDADAYSALSLTAFDYYNYNTDRGYLRLGGDGITASQYSSITT